MEVIIQKKRNSINFVENFGEVYETLCYHGDDTFGILAVLCDCISCKDDVSVRFYEDEEDA